MIEVAKLMNKERMGESERAQEVSRAGARDGISAAGGNKKKKSAAESGNEGKRGTDTALASRLSLFFSALSSSRSPTLLVASAAGRRRRVSPTISSGIVRLLRGGGIPPSVLLALSFTAMFASDSFPIQWSLDNILLSTRVEFRSILFGALLTFLVLIIGTLRNSSSPPTRLGQSSGH